MRAVTVMGKRCASESDIASQTFSAHHVRFIHAEAVFSSTCLPSSPRHFKAAENHGGNKNLGIVNGPNTL